MRIPNQLKLAGQTITIVKDPQLYETRKIVGEALYSKQQILLDSGTCTEEQMQQNFLHELMHWVFFIMNEDTLRNNEKIVDLVAHFLHQAHVTCTYDDK